MSLDGGARIDSADDQSVMNLTTTRIERGCSAAMDQSSFTCHGPTFISLSCSRTTSTLLLQIVLAS